MKGMKRRKNVKCDSIFSFEHNLKSNPAQPGVEDPVLAAKKRKKKAKEDPVREPSNVMRAKPSFGVRQDIKSHCLGNEPVLTYGEPRRAYDPPKYIPPKTKKYLKDRVEARKMYEKDLNFCKHIFEPTQMPKTSEKGKVLQVKATLPPKLPREKRIFYSFDRIPYIE
ncbi:hypothetical protein WA026_015866 [Henosepilachna vigintioctopunctata]|uniref:Enkurin n=1 Tax=Henosepilachna vigintioctopunctata TaxID=420089 RepID=A0AAW1V393_9CUCU